VYDSPVGYTDPSGHWPLGPVIPYLAVRDGAEGTIALNTTLDRARRDYVGGNLVVSLDQAIRDEAIANGVNPVVTAAMLRHERSSLERRVFTLTMRQHPGVMANAAEAAQVILMGDRTSIGPGQMQLRRARELEQLGYASPRHSDRERVADLLSAEGAVEYVTGMVTYLDHQLQEVAGYSLLAPEIQARLLLIGYNLGWPQLSSSLAGGSIKAVIASYSYDNQTVDEYLRWKAAR